MDPRDLLSCAGADGQALLAAARLDWTRQVATCPGWDAGDLLRHMGSILEWIGATVTTAQRQSRRQLPKPPDEPAALASWYAGHLRRTLTILRQADPDAKTWTFSTLPDQRAGWWHRRLAVEIAIHRWDAELAAGLAPSALDDGVAAGGIAEFMTDFLPALLADHRDTAGITGTLHVHATDGESEWWADLDSPGTVLAEHRRGDVAIQGSRSDLLLWLTNRQSADSLTVFGQPTLVRSWPALAR